MRRWKYKVVTTSDLRRTMQQHSDTEWELVGFELSSTAGFTQYHELIFKCPIDVGKQEVGDLATREW